MITSCSIRRVGQIMGGLHRISHIEKKSLRERDRDVNEALNETNDTRSRRKQAAGTRILEKLNLNFEVFKLWN